MGPLTSAATAFPSVLPNSATGRSAPPSLDGLRFRKQPPSDDPHVADFAGLGGAILYHGDRHKKQAPRFPDILPDSSDTPLWRRLLFHLFDGYEDLDQLSTSHLWALPPEQSSPAVAERFARVLESSGSLRRAIWWSQARRLTIAALLTIGSLACSLLLPLVMFDLLSFVTTHGYASMIRIYVDLALLYLCSQLDTVFSRHSDYMSVHAHMEVESALRTLLFDQTLHGVASDTGVRQHRLAEVAQLYTDTELSLGIMIIALPVTIRHALETVGELFIVVNVLSVPFVNLLAGLAVISIGLLATNIFDFRVRRRWGLQNAERVHAVHMCFKSILMVKLNAWEAKMQARITKARADEDRERWSVAFIHAVQRSLYLDVPHMVSILVFAWMELTPNAWSSASAFTMLLLLRRLMGSVSHALWCGSYVLKGHLALQKLDEFVNQAARNTRESSKSTKEADVRRPDDDVALELSRVCVVANGDPTKALLLHVNVRIRKGELVVITGSAGAGKSTLLSALAGVATCLHGTIRRSEQMKMAFCSQEPWLQTSSIRDNILFGETFNAEKYWCVMDACGLIEDMHALPEGDATQVGPKGINLSGGQKSRIALARACYSDADVILLDSPFASVDAIVQSDVFSRCILELLRFKTVVVVTHNPEIISCPLVDQVIEVTGMTTAVTVTANQEGSGQGERLSRRVMDSIWLPPWRKAVDATTVASASAQTELNIYPVKLDAHERDPDITANTETPAIVSEASSTAEAAHIFFCQRDSGKLLLIAAVSLVVFGVLCVAKDLWLVKWSDSLSVRMLSGTNEPSRSAIMYGALVVGSVMASAYSAVLVAWAAFDGATGLFSRMTVSLLQAPISFFYTTPIGEILNLYLTDMDRLDMDMARPVLQAFRAIVAFLSCAAMVWHLMGIWSLPITLLVGFFIKKVLTVKFYVRLTHLHSDVHAKLLNFMSESLDGVAVIRGFGGSQIDRFLELHGQLSDTVIRSTLTEQAFNNYVVTRCALVHGGLLLLLALVVTINASDVAISPSVLGLLIYYVFLVHDSTTGLYNGLLVGLLGLRNVKHVRQYCAIESENELRSIKPVLLPPKWPTRGSLVFDHVWFQYANDTPDLKMPLRDVSFQINGGEKIGIIGRTGSGKSSIAMALFRMHSLSRGRILVDDVDVCRLALSELRSKICVIPQTPLFYRCSVRDYLDPFGEFEDARLWSELTKCGLRDTVHSLDDELWDNGENWSLGERQMLGLSRALLRPSRILILDESFTALDQTSETRLMQVLDTDFRDATVLLITHRLDLVLKFDRIMVMRSGELVEFGDVEELASNPSSAFYDFLETTLLTC